jgi:hypothetical protein
MSKILRKKTCIFVLIGLFLLLILPGLVIRNVKISTKIAIHKPVSAVYVGLADPTNLPYWFEGFQKIEHIQGMPMVPGSIYRITWKKEGHVYSAMEKVEKLDWKKNLKLEMLFRGFRINSDLYFFEIDKITYVKGTHVVSAHGLWNRIILPWARHRIKKEIEQNLDRFKDMMGQH